MLLIGDNCLKMLSDTRRLNKQQNQGKRSKCWDASRQKNLASGDSALTKTMRPSPFSSSRDAGSGVHEIPASLFEMILHVAGLMDYVHS